MIFDNPGVVMRFRTVFFCLLVIFAVASIRPAVLSLSARILGPPKDFDFSYFESLPDDARVQAAELYLDRKYPKGSDAIRAVHEIEEAGAKCGRVEDRGTYYLCTYTVQALFQTEWHIAFLVADGTSTISKTLISRGITAP
jgi:hypothetical protein